MLFWPSCVCTQDLRYINGYDDPEIIAGAGTIGIEIFEQVRDVDAVIVPVGGAGLIAGIALAIKTLKPEVTVIGAQPELCPSFSAALAAGKPVHAFKSASLADGLTVPMVRRPRLFSFRLFVCDGFSFLTAYMVRHA
jgi:threonine dehydratase